VILSGCQIFRHENFQTFLRGMFENLKIEQPKIKSNKSIALRSSSHGSRTAEEEEEIIEPEDQDEAEIQEGQSSRQSYHRSELVSTPHIWSCLFSDSLSSSR
jgi:hypothetical protein